MVELLVAQGKIYLCVVFFFLQKSSYNYCLKISMNEGKTNKYFLCYSKDVRM